MSCKALDNHTEGRLQAYGWHSRQAVRRQADRQVGAGDLVAGDPALLPLVPVNDLPALHNRSQADYDVGFRTREAPCYLPTVEARLRAYPHPIAPRASSSRIVADVQHMLGAHKLASAAAWKSRTSRAWPCRLRCGRQRGAWKCSHTHRHQFALPLDRATAGQRRRETAAPAGVVKQLYPAGERQQRQRPVRPGQDRHRHIQRQPDMGLAAPAPPRSAFRSGARPRFHGGRTWSAITQRARP